MAKKVDEKTVKLVISDIKRLVRKHGLETVKRAVRRWNTAVTEKSALEKEMRGLKRRLADARRKLK